MPQPTMSSKLPDREDLGQTWAYLELGIARVMNDLTEGIDMQTYMGVYTCVSPTL
jgi:cullin 1